MYQDKKRESVKDIIAKSLIDLSKRKLFIDITVSELVSVAQVSRASFYRNYGSIDDVLSYIVDEIYKGLMEKLTSSLIMFKQDQWYESGVNLFRYIHEVKDRFFEIESENASYILHRLKKKYESNPNSTSSDNKDHYLHSAIIGIIYTIADKWRKCGYQESPETIALITIKIIKPIIQTWDNKPPSIS